MRNPCKDPPVASPFQISTGRDKRKNEGMVLMIEDTLLSQRIPYPLSLHFKALDSVGELLEAIPLPYVRQCIKQTAITPFERAALLALVDTMEINQ